MTPSPKPVHVIQSGAPSGASEAAGTVPTPEPLPLPAAAINAAEKKWLGKFHTACSECLTGDAVAALERKHEAAIKQIGLPATEIVLAHMMRVAGKSSPAEADERVRRIIG